MGITLEKTDTTLKKNIWKVELEFTEVQKILVEKSMTEDEVLAALKDGNYAEITSKIKNIRIKRIY